MKTKLTKDEYEAHVLKHLRDYLIPKRDPRVEGDGTIRVEDVRLDTSRDDEHMVEVILSDATRPKCRFGWRYPATEADDREDPTPWEAGPSGPEQAEVWAHAFALTNLQEQLEAAGHGLPDECDPERVTWVGPYKP